MSLGILIERSKHNGQNNLHIVADQIAEVLVVPEVKSTFCDLEMRACNGLGKLMEEWFLNLGKLCWVHDLKDILNFVQEHDFFCAVDLRPVSQ